MYDFVLFDLDQTLLYRRPTLPERVWELASRRQPGLSRKTVDRAWAEGEFWQGEADPPGERHQGTPQR